MAPNPKDELKAIIDQADRLKNEPTAKDKPLRHYRSDSLSVYSSLFPWRVHNIWWLLLILGPAGLTLFSILPGHSPWIIDLLLWLASGAAFAFLMASGLIWLIRFSHFRNWRKRVQVRVEGWQRLVGSRRFRDPYHWRQCTIQLHLLYHATIDQPSLQHVLSRFCTEANNSGYPASLSADPRHRWVLEDGRLCGSVNCQVAKLIYDLCHNLSELNRVEPTVESILITTAGEDRSLEKLAYRTQS